MSQPTARELMTSPVVTVPPETPVGAIAALLAERGISAVPVVAADGVLQGIVTEADLIRRLAGADKHAGGFFRSLFADNDRLARRYTDTHGRTAAEVMTARPVTVPPSATLAAIVDTLEEKNIRRVLVVEDGQLCGVVSRADLLRAIVKPPSAQEGAEVTDEKLRQAVLTAMKQEPWAETFYTLVEVHDGVVELHGFSRSPAVQRGLRVLASEVPGVKRVEDHTQPIPPYLFPAD
ncbi:CBS domain-containing protein [Pseudoroseomonas globiformis]|uniref:CBS domain-containing protein n=1 Tax=Teichococcus globiformis TaxID=2307229 RepID=A0ABV7G2N6_9PROT